jgi:hypothetical protein
MTRWWEQTRCRVDEEYVFYDTRFDWIRREADGRQTAGGAQQNLVSAFLFLENISTDDEITCFWR